MLNGYENAREDTTQTLAGYQTLSWRAGKSDTQKCDLNGSHS